MVTWLLCCHVYTMGDEFFSLLVYGQRLGRDPRCSAYLELCSTFCLPFEFHSHSQEGVQQQLSPLQPGPNSVSLSSQLFLKPELDSSRQSKSCSAARREVLVNSFLSSMGLTLISQLCSLSSLTSAISWPATLPSVYV